MGFYVLSLNGAYAFTPVISGFIAQYQGWRWVFYWPAIFYAVVFLFLFLFMEETRYIRKATRVPISGADMVKSDTAKNQDSQKGQDSPSISPSTDGEVFYPPKTFLQKLSVFHKYPSQGWFKRTKRSFTYLTWPVVFYAGFTYGSYLVWNNVLNNVASITLAAPPYNFSEGMVGLAFLSATFGALTGCAFSGPLSDWLTLRLARRNNGVMEAEHRLWPFAACVIIMPGALILWGVGAAHQIHWFGLLVAMFLSAMTLIFGGTLGINYLIDSYHELAEDAIVTIILIRNTLYFGVSYG